MSSTSLRQAITHKRDGGRNTQDELQAVAMAAAETPSPDGQLAAWLMAAYLKGLDAQETAWLTRAMADSGETLDLSSLPKPWVDKHSTGGVGDKTTLVLMPLLAACDITMVKMSGRGLGLTGGTVDKLESVPGFRVNLTPEEMLRQAKEVGCALTGQTPRLAPADGVLYSLRDATATVDSIPLIVASILSKKIAGGAETIMLDVKCGSGAMMTTLASGRALGAALEETGKSLGVPVHAHLTDMDQPLGRAVGNALEVKEAIRILRGDEDGSVKDLCLALAEMTLATVGKDPAQAASVLASGAALQMAMHWFHAQGANMDVFDDEEWQTAPSVEVVEHAGPGGWVERVDARQVGEFVVSLGGGRQKKGAEIDYRVGVEVLARVGDRIEPGQPLLRVHSASPWELPPDWIRVSSTQTSPRPLILD